MSEQTPNSIKIYNTAKDNLGKALAENSVLGCAETVNAIVEMATGTPVGGEASTYSMYQCLQETSRWLKVDSPLPGDIIISPTSYGNGTLSHGHVGIVGIYGILSNNSEDGKLEEKLNMKTWNRIYGIIGGFPIEFYRCL